VAIGLSVVKSRSRTQRQPVAVTAQWLAALQARLQAQGLVPLGPQANGSSTLDLFRLVPWPVPAAS
jgi:hypothetical protein